MGLGFGLQEIFGNFISGLILLFERRIRLGDVVTVGDVSGQVTRIRVLATTVRSWERKEFIVPNKDLITGRLLNWTLSDDVNRLVVNAGVAYGTDTKRARELMVQVARRHPEVMADPAPFATFEQFGDNSLLLTMRAFILDLNRRWAISTDLHEAVAKAFAKAGIEIAFPSGTCTCAAPRLACFRRPGTRRTDGIRSAPGARGLASPRGQGKRRFLNHHHCAVANPTSRPHRTQSAAPLSGRGIPPTLMRSRPVISPSGGKIAATRAKSPASTDRASRPALVGCLGSPSDAYGCRPGS